MDTHVEELIDRIKKDGVAVAESSASEKIAQAQREADKIILDAKEEAEKILMQAKEETARLEKARLPRQKLNAWKKQVKMPLNKPEETFFCNLKTVLQKSFLRS